MPPVTRSAARKRNRMEAASANNDEVVPLVGSSSHINGENGHVANEKSSLKGDYSSIALLLLLYTLQGIPLGLAESVSYLLQEKGLTYDEQGIYDSVSWPFSLKLLWAPIVDACFIKSVGRRKTWLVPVQLIIGIALVSSPAYVQRLMGEGGDGDSRPQVWPLTYFFFSLYFLCATQDIAVDGWALTMLSKKNVSYASVCNAAGQTFGFFLSFTGFLTLNTYGLATLHGFMFYSGIAFLVTTIGVWLFKVEKLGRGHAKDAEDENMTIVGAYKRMGKVLKLRSIQLLALLMFTRNIGFVATDKLPSRKLIQWGMKKEHLATLMAVMTPISIAIPGIVSKRVGDRPLHFFMRSYLPRLAVGILAMALLAVAPDFKSYADTMPMTFMVLLFTVSVIHSIVSTAMFVAIMAFFAKISDPSIGGTYMTLLNTITNLGAKWPGQIVLFLVDPLTLKTCNVDGGESVCETTLDGFFVLSALCIVAGMVWYFALARSLATKLERFPSSMWSINTGAKERKRDVEMM